MKSSWRKDLTGAFGKAAATPPVSIKDTGGMAGSAITDGAVVIAAITSCTNTSNPSVMIGAGLVARNARKRGLKRKPWVKTSLAPAAVSSPITSAAPG